MGDGEKEGGMEYWTSGKRLKVEGMAVSHCYDIVM